MTAIIDKNMLKQALRELIHEEPDFFKQLLAEIYSDLKKEHLEKIVNEDFKEYGDVFKALA
jgi:hypothetical protein